MYFDFQILFFRLHYDHFNKWQVGEVTHVASSHQGKENSGVNLKHKSLDLMFFFSHSPQHLAAQTSRAL